jgi:DNA-binding MarR family transcriptional regulator
MEFTFGTGPATSAKMLSPESLPQVPSVVALFALYQTITGEEANTWGMFPCGDVCGTSHVLRVGRMLEESEAVWHEGDLLIHSGKRVDRIDDVLHFTPEGSLLGWDRSFTEDRYGPDASQGTAQVGFDAQIERSALETITEWHVPYKVAAGSAFVAALAAIGYWLWPVLKMGPMALFSRLKRDKLLDNPHRQAIMQAVESQPGVHYRELVRNVGLPGGTVKHHLDKLVEGGLVTVVAGPGYSCYFKPGTEDRRLMESVAVLKSPVAWGILEAVRSEGGTTASEVARRLGVTPPTVHHHLKRLEQAGLVRRQRKGRSVCLLATTQGRLHRM